MVWTLDAKWVRCDVVGSVASSTVCVVVDSGKHQRVVDGSRLPWRTTVCPSRTRHELASNVTVYPASQNFAVERREVCARPGTMWACRAAGFNVGMSSSHVCVERRVAPLGRVMVMGLLAGCLFRTWWTSPVMK